MSSRSNGSASSRPRLLARRAAALVALALLLCAGAPAAEAAKKRVVVLDFSGPRAGKFQPAVVKGLRKVATVIPQRRFTAAAKKVKRFKANAEGVSKVARRLDAHGVLTGKVTRKRGRYTLTISIREGQSGEFVAEEIVVTTKRPKLTRAQERKIERELRAIVRGLPSPDAEPEEEELEEEAPEETPVAEEEPEEEEPTRTASAEEGGEDRDGKDEGGDGDDDDDDEEVSGSVKLSAAQQADLDARGRAIDLTAGLSVVSRSLTFDFEPGQAQTPQGYDGAMVPGLYVNGELYPMALVNKSSTGFMRNIGLTAVLDKVLLIKSKPLDMDVDLPTSQTRFGVGLVYRWNFGSSPTSPTLKLSARYNKLSFTVDETAAPDAMVTLPDVSYAYIDPGVGLRFPVSEKIAAFGEARYLVVSGAGPISDPEQYGGTSASGLDLELGGEYKLGSTLAIRAGFRLLRIGMTFDGTGTLADRNGDMTQDVQSATDQYLGFHASAGWLF